MNDPKKDYIRKPFRDMAVRLLDSDNGITEGAYYSILALAEALTLNRDANALRLQVDATDGMFYLKDWHTLKGWITS